MRTTARTSSDLSYSPPFSHVLFALGLFPFAFSSHGILSFGIYPCFPFKHRRLFRFLACFLLLSFLLLDLPLYQSACPSPLPAQPRTRAKRTQSRLKNMDLY